MTRVSNNRVHAWKFNVCFELIEEVIKQEVSSRKTNYLVLKVTYWW